MYLIELAHSASIGPKFEPTEKFSRIYGNYCGTGNQGGEPIDAIDAACKGHDECYHYKGRKHCDCDKTFVNTLDSLLKTKLTFKQRVAATAMKVYFRGMTGKVKP